ncbi:hypothetical protein CFBP5877_00330 [Agrobacterium tumefaciens]|uniref:Uncharacterized protein n=1 Tax=Agrobacterium tumefaciens TaxID=358 RepID=A0AAE6BC19_AGRTU|nr:hypothetical protein CFBP5499_00330 [Agrobacterium tumefaciens]QCL80168.1 hypothetical protein CFBP5877_00330 [Agrobacterium tumefaciens]
MHGIYNIINVIRELLRKNDNFETKSLAFGMRTF